ncbi:hypothetical protein DSO57_1004022 [Entomophthora muscae]|uniref:Uncharacterized protein n=1 Tax=Entomophthora muscae TaxID=34485 RepID=A0ACC2T910_9FUNG|nr:hypothetical protein DSO57_1004022 [Entomophthora muscae]
MDLFTYYCIFLGRVPVGSLRDRFCITYINLMEFSIRTTQVFVGRAKMSLNSSKRASTESLLILG